MDTVTLVRIHAPAGTGRTTGWWILTSLLVLGVLALAGCGTPAATPTAITEECWQAITAGDTEAALDLFIDGALVTVNQSIFEGKDRIRDWIDNDIAFLRQGGECSEWSRVMERADRIDFYAGWTIEDVSWQGHHTLYFSNGKIRSWTMTFWPSE